MVRNYRWKHRFGGSLPKPDRVGKFNRIDTHSQPNEIQSRTCGVSHSLVWVWIYGWSGNVGIGLTGAN